MKKKVIVAMSGGVDSSVAALLMKEKGYEVVGVFLKCWSDTKDFSGECTWKEERRYAHEICRKLDIPLVTVDAEKDYRKYVVDEMFKDYRRGITPNPDVLCNEVVKFPYLLKAAKKFGADAVVTGHYVSVRKGSMEELNLYRGKDEGKDQSYFLYRLTKKDLKKLIFPIGKYTKAEVRSIAKKNGFINHSKKSTVGICFIGKTDMKKFLKLKIKPKAGKIVDPEGKVIGAHDGVYYYTIGQRLRPGIDLNIKKEKGSHMPRWYVASKDVKKNILTVAPSRHEILYRDFMVVKEFHLINDDAKKFKTGEHKVHARIRHVGELIPSLLKYNKKKKRFELKLSRGIDGVSNGQAVVLYKGRRVLGGGEISG